MSSDDRTYGDLIRLDPGNPSGEETLRRVALGTSAQDGGVDETSLRDLLFQFPRSLPVSAIDAAYSDPVPICRELRTPAGPIDAVYINELGRLVLAEFKLWRNPQARREVIGQLLDIAAGSGTECIVMGLSDDVAATLHSLDILVDVPAGRIVGTLDEARRSAREALEVDATARSG